jgi:mono/diheme cytochrome c family protein
MVTECTERRGLAAWNLRARCAYGALRGGSGYDPGALAAQGNPIPASNARSDHGSQLGVVLIVGALLWSIRPMPMGWALVAAYLLAWLLVGSLRHTRLWPRLSLSRLQASLLAALLIAAPVAAALRQVPEFLRAEGLRGIGERLVDRLHVERENGIAPRVLHTDRPQTFYVHAHGADRASLRISPQTELVGDRLAEGIFRIDYNPASDGLPSVRSGPFAAELRLDGDSIEREMFAVTPRAHPRWFAVDLERGRAATTSEETDEVYLVRATPPIQRSRVGDGPTGASFFADGTRLAVSHRYTGALWILNTESAQVVDRVPLPPFQTGIATSPDDAELAVAIAGLEPGVQLVGAGDLAPGAFVPLDFAPEWICYGPDADTLIVSSLEARALYRLRRRDGSWRVDARLPLGRPAVTLARSRDGQRVYVAVTDYRKGSGANWGNHFVEDQVLTIDTERFAVTEQLLTGRRSPEQDLPGNIDRGASPMGIAEREDGALLVAFAGTDEVWIVPPDRGATPAMISTHDAGLTAPHGIADLGNGNAVVSSPSSGLLAFLSATGTGLGQIAATDEQLAAEDPHALWQRRGERVFYEATRSGVSCQSCHPGGGSDYSDHNLGQRILLPTLTSRGIAGTSPYLRDGSRGRVSHLLDLSEGEYRGFLRPETDRAKAIDAYINALALPVNPRQLAGRDVDGERAGLEVFMNADCVRCHPAPAFTNLSQQPASALFPDWANELAARTGTRLVPGGQSRILDVASLRGLEGSAPYLRDGRALSLEEIFKDHNPRNRHGNTEGLSDDELELLVQFLESL